MRKPRPNSNQIDLPFDGNLALKPEATPKQETRPATPYQKEVKMPPVSEIVNRYASPEPDDDKDEDPRAQAAREWKQYRGGRRA